MSEFDVCVVGAGPVGLTLALDLAKRGISVAVVDKELQPGPWPKMERCNARSMEIYRRLASTRKSDAMASPRMVESVAIVTVSAICPCLPLTIPRSPPCARRSRPQRRSLRASRTS